MHPCATDDRRARGSGRRPAGAEARGVDDGRQPDPYKVLQVDPEAEDEVIQAAYRRLAQKYHPDVVGPGRRRSGRMAAINAAWETLGDPMRRAAYDRERAAAARPGAAQASPAGAAAARDRRRSGPASARPSAADRRRASPSDRSGPAPARRIRRTPATSAPDRLDAETVSGDWTSGRSTVGSGYDPEDDARAGGLRCCRAAARKADGQRPELRPIRRAGRWARSPAETSSTWSGSTACRSGGSTATRST